MYPTGDKLTLRAGAGNCAASGADDLYCAKTRGKAGANGVAASYCGMNGAGAGNVTGATGPASCMGGITKGAETEAAVSVIGSVGGAAGVIGSVTGAGCAMEGAEIGGAAGSELLSSGFLPLEEAASASVLSSSSLSIRWTSSHSSSELSGGGGAFLASSTSAWYSASRALRRSPAAGSERGGGGTLRGVLPLVPNCRGTGGAGGGFVGGGGARGGGTNSGRGKNPSGCVGGFGSVSLSLTVFCGAELGLLSAAVGVKGGASASRGTGNDGLFSGSLPFFERLASGAEPLELPVSFVSPQS